MLLLALQYGGNQFAWNSATVIGLFCGAGATFIIFMLWSWRAGENAMIPTLLIRQRVVWTSCLVMTFNMALIFVTNYYLPIYFQVVKGASPFKSGIDILPSILSQMLFVIFSGFMGEFNAKHRLRSVTFIRNVLTSNSWQAWLLHPMEHSQLDHQRNRLWPYHHIYEL